jgi:8-oxo-dGTP pyrophosphatase MutT (NUDIX family)
VSAELLASARAYADGTRMPVEPRNAATVVLLRPGIRSASVYLLRRHTDMAFAAGRCVFPGGAVDERDFEPVARIGPSVEVWSSRLGVEPRLAGALVCAAVRETFEESGVLLAGSGRSVVSDTLGEDWERDRVALEVGELSLSELLTRRKLALRADLLGVWAGWLTPVFEARRYRTWFFVARVPDGQAARDVSTESDRVVWLDAAAAVADVDLGQLQMMPPTYLTCLEVSEFADVASVIEAAESRRVEMFLPEVIEAPDGATMSMPPGAAALLARHRARSAS